jgi:nucleoside-diphosphate-sugar epimerase
MAPNPLILVTGGGGFVGSRLAEIVFLTRCARLRVGVRSWAGAARPARFPMDIVLCDVLDVRQVNEAIRGVDVVVHCAVGNERVIVEGTRNVLHAAARTGVERLVHLSTAEVYGSSVIGAISENAPLTGGSAYANAKMEAEQLVWESGVRGLPVTVFRPSIVYGPWSEQWTAALAQRLLSGGWSQYSHYGEGICNLVYVDDLVAATLASIHEEQAIGQAFNVGGPDVLTWNEYFGRFNAAMGRPPLEITSARKARVASAARGTVRAVAQVVLSPYSARLQRAYDRGGWIAPVMKGTKRWLGSSPSSTELEQLYSRKALYDWSKAERLLGYRPAFDLGRGLGLSVDWLRYAGLLN